MKKLIRYGISHRLTLVEMLSKIKCGIPLESQMRTLTYIGLNKSLCCWIPQILFEYVVLLAFPFGLSSMALIDLVSAVFSGVRNIFFFSMLNALPFLFHQRSTLLATADLHTLLPYGILNSSSVS